MDIFDVITLLGGLALFLYGMNTMGQGLEKAAGEKLHTIIEAVTGNLPKAVLTGAAVTAVIQSSSATTVMVVGFVNAGIMSLKQAVGIIMGANIGTTVTSLLISMNVISGGNILMKFLKPTTLAPLAIFIGMLMIMGAKKQKIKELGEILVGFGVLFTGLQVMEGAVSGLKDVPEFRQVFAVLTNPILGVLAGAGITAIIQSSSASVGILQAVATTGAVTWGSAVPIILGQNIGTCVTAMLSSIGASKNARRAAFIHLYFNVIGSCIFLVAVYALHGIFNFSFWGDTINSFGIAQVHIAFNVINTFIMMPLSGLLVKLAIATVPDGAEPPVVEELEERFLKTPPIALEQCRRAVIRMAGLARTNYQLGYEAVIDRDLSKAEEVAVNEETIDKMEFNISQYLVKLNELGLNGQERRMSSILLQMVNDLERIGDHCDNLADTAKSMSSQDIAFTDAAHKEINSMFQAVKETLDMTVDAYTNNDSTLARHVEPLEDVVDQFKELLRTRHVERLNKGECTVENGVCFLEVVTDLERIADHCLNVAFYVLEQNDPSLQDMHSYYYDTERQQNSDYEEFLTYYKNKYYNNICNA